MLLACKSIFLTCGLFQQFMIDRMEVQLKFMVGKVKGMQTSNMASESEETPPPHY